MYLYSLYYGTLLATVAREESSERDSAERIARPYYVYRTCVQTYIHVLLLIWAHQAANTLQLLRHARTRVGVYSEKCALNLPKTVPKNNFHCEQQYMRYYVWHTPCSLFWQTWAPCMLYHNKNKNPCVVVKESVLDAILYNLSREKEKGEDLMVPILDSCSFIIRCSITYTCTSYARTRHIWGVCTSVKDSPWPDTGLVPYVVQSYMTLSHEEAPHKELKTEIAFCVDHMSPFLIPCESRVTPPASEC
jgi:hypothetical protein